MGLFALMPVVAFLLVTLGLPDHATLIGDGGAAGTILPWSAVGLANAGMACLFLVMTLRHARRR